MIASELISESLIPLRTSDSGSEALGIMNDYYVKHLPIVNTTQLLGILSDVDILDHDIQEPVGSYDLSIPTMVKVNHNDHLFEVLGLMSDYKLTVLPVVDKNGDYIGLITQEDLIQYYANSFSFSEPGSIIVLEMEKKDYALSEISRIIEQESAAILGVFISSLPDASRILVTIKINKNEIQYIKASLERYGYIIKASFLEEDYVDALKERYDLLMNYLSV